MSVAPTNKPKQRSGSLRRTVRDFIDLFLERWWIGAIVGVVAGVSYVVLQPHRTPVFRAEVQLLFETKSDNVVNMRPVQEMALQSASELNTHMEEMRSNTFFRYFLNSFSKEEVEKIQAPYRDPLKPDAAPQDIAAIIGQDLSISAHRGTSIVSISITNRNSEMAAFIANRIANSYIDYKVASAKSGTNTAITFLRERLEELRGEVESAEKELIDYRKNNKLAALGEAQEQAIQLLGTLKSSLNKLQLERIEQKALLDKIDEKRRAGADLLEIPEILAAPNVSEQRAALAVLRTERAILDQTYDSEAKQVKANETRIREAQRQLNESVDHAIVILRVKYDDIIQREARLNAEATDNEFKVRQLESLAVNNKNLEAAVAQKRALYASIGSRLSETSITSQLDHTTMIRIFDPAFAPGFPTNDGVGAVTAKAVGVGSMVLFLLPLMIGFFDTRIRSPLQVEDGLGEPLLGTVKPMPKMSATERANIYRLQKDPALAESYRGIYSEIEVRSTLAYPKTLVLTSSVPQEGKSQLSCNLAAVFASHKRRTLLVDCDLRRPTLHRYFGLKVETGWVDWMEQPASERPSIPSAIITLGENFDLLPAGRMPGNPTEVLDRLANRAVIEPLLKVYDLVIFDTPPVGIFPDAVLLARSCHEAVFVCRYRTVRLAPACKNIDRLHEAGIVVLGVVLNQLPEAKARAYGYEGYGAQAEGYYRAYKTEDRS